MNPIIKYFNENVAAINQLKTSAKFTKNNFLHEFLNHDSIEDSQAKRKRIQDMLSMSEEFLSLVNDLKDDVFKPTGLPSLLTKD